MGRGCRQELGVASEATGQVKVILPAEDLETEQAGRAKGSCSSLRDPWKIRLMIKMGPGYHPCQHNKKEDFPAPGGRPITQIGLCFAYTSPQPSPQWELSLEKRRVMQRISGPDCGSQIHFKLFKWEQNEKADPGSPTLSLFSNRCGQCWGCSPGDLSQKDK